MNTQGKNVENRPVPVLFSNSQVIYKSPKWYGSFLNCDRSIIALQANLYVKRILVLFVSIFDPQFKVD